jgi:hypothetical protein
MMAILMIIFLIVFIFVGSLEVWTCDAPFGMKKPKAQKSMK